MSAPDLSASLTAMDWLPRLSAGGAMSNVAHPNYNHPIETPKVKYSLFPLAFHAIPNCTQSELDLFFTFLVGWGVASSPSGSIRPCPYHSGFTPTSHHLLVPLPFPSFSHHHTFPPSKIPSHPHFNLLPPIHFSCI